LKFIVCEGKNDQIFLNKILENYFNNNSPFTIHDDMGRAQEVFRRGGRNYLTQNYDIFIYQDNGVPIIYNVVVPRLIKEAWLKIEENLSLLLITDQDFKPESFTNTIIQRITENITQTVTALVDVQSNNSVKYTTVNIGNFSTEVFIYLIPVSLESQYIQYFNKSMGNKIKRCKILPQDLSTHDHLDKILECLGYESFEKAINTSLEEN